MDERYLLRYEKISDARYIGHIDFIRMFQRAVRRAGLPAASTGGYNPRMKFTVALALPLGYAGYSEYAELVTTRRVPCGEVADLLNSNLPAGVRITGARFLNEKEKGPASSVRAAAYEAVLNDACVSTEQIENYLNGLPEEERPISLEVANGNKIIMTVAQGIVKNIKPSMVVSSLCDRTRIRYDPIGTTYSRLELYKTGDGALTPMFDG